MSEHTHEIRITSTFDPDTDAASAEVWEYVQFTVRDVVRYLNDERADFNRARINTEGAG